MKLSRRLSAILAFLVLAASVHPIRGDESPSLTPNNFNRWRDFIRPSKTELAYREIIITGDHPCQKPSQKLKLQTSPSSSGP